ncbi:hypothetical protein FG386_002043 [Cryptosporidium ryanae]|uniref:uncharacterized protein n=1 Tax=Cryptosporidium ryanae TaxID=515981 RepID=UPI00351A11C9|nr:hypothetical protein FG386_002043 [Cryptosporidium ryanae]
MDGEKLGDELNYMLLCWESRHVSKSSDKMDSLYSKLDDLSLKYKGETTVEDTISPIINKYIAEIEGEIERKNEIKRKEKLELERLRRLEEEERERKKQEEIKREQEKKEEKKNEELKDSLEKKGISFKTDSAILNESASLTEKIDVKSKKVIQDEENDLTRLFEYSKSIETVDQFEKSSEYKEIVSSTESSVKSTRINTKKTIQLSINQISSTNQQIILSSKRIKNTLSDMRFSSSTDIPVFYNYSLYLTATLFLDQCSSQISAHPESVWCYSYSCMQILEDNEDFIYFLEGVIFKEFKFLYTSNLDDIVIKYDRSNNSEDSFIKRLGSVVKFYLSINILRGRFGKIWIWLVKLLNDDKPHKLFPIVMISVVQIISYFFKDVFRIQYIKIIDYILIHKLPRIYGFPNDDSIPIKAHCNQLEGLLNDIKSVTAENGFNSPPNGFIIKDKHIDVDC